MEWWTEWSGVAVYLRAGCGVGAAGVCGARMVPASVMTEVRVGGGAGRSGRVTEAEFWRE